MPLQILPLKLDGITAGDYLTWCRDPDPPALDSALRSIAIDADPLGDTIIAILDWNQPLPAARAAATSAGLPPSPGVQVHQSQTDRPHSCRVVTEAGPHLTRAPGAAVGGASGNAEQRLPHAAGVDGQLRTAA
jgi:hypothetical protein